MTLEKGSEAGGLAARPQESERARCRGMVPWPRRARTDAAVSDASLGRSERRVARPPGEDLQ